MARALRLVLLGFFVAVPVVGVATIASPVRAAEMDKRAKADVKEAMRFYKEGSYEDAAKIFLRLSIAYPEMLVFVRNLGACYYYMRRFEPALSNLRDYVHRKRDIAPDDRAEVERWIGEMERLRDQSTPVAAGAPASASPPVTTAPVAAAPLAPSPPGPFARPAGTPEPPAAATPGEPPTALPEAATGPTAYPVSGQSPSAYPAAAGAGSAPQGYPGAYEAQPPYAPGDGRTAYGDATAVPPAGVIVPPAPEAQPSNGARKTVAWVLGGVGAASVLAGVYCTTLALDRFSKVEKRYDSDAEKEGKAFAAAQWVGYGLGAALITTAVIVGTTGSASSAVAFAPSIAPDGAGAIVTGQF